MLSAMSSAGSSAGWLAAISTNRAPFSGGVPAWPRFLPAGALNQPHSPLPQHEGDAPWTRPDK